MSQNPDIRLDRPTNSLFRKENSCASLKYSCKEKTPNKISAFQRSFSNDS